MEGMIQQLMPWLPVSAAAAIGVLLVALLVSVSARRRERRRDLERRRREISYRLKRFVGDGPPVSSSVPSSETDSAGPGRPEG